MSNFFSRITVSVQRLSCITFNVSFLIDFAALITGKSHFSDSEKIMKFRLKEEVKVKDGFQVKETIFLNLTCSNHSWSKTKRSAKMSSGVIAP